MLYFLSFLLKSKQSGSYWQRLPNFRDTKTGVSHFTQSCPSPLSFFLSFAFHLLQLPHLPPFFVLFYSPLNQTSTPLHLLCKSPHQGKPFPIGVWPFFFFQLLVAYPSLHLLINTTRTKFISLYYELWEAPNTQVPFFLCYLIFSFNNYVISPFG